MNDRSLKVVYLVLDFIGDLAFGFLGFGLKVCENRPILDLYSFIEQHILALCCHLLILQV